MTRKNKQIPIANDVVDSNLTDLIENRYARYSKYIIQDRALPDVRDGLKPVQRRILYAMHKDGNLSTKPYRKSAKTVGLVIGNYHPHGDSSVYEAMVRMSQSWKMNKLLIDMQGNNGSIDDDPAAAMRYTECRLAPISETLLTDIEEETVDFTLNFSDTELEPVVLPVGYCNLLVNGATGIASGYATSIPPFNLKDVTNACIYRLQNPNCDHEDIYNIIKAPDFPTGGIIQGKEDALEILKTGKGKVVVRSKTAIEETKKLKRIVVTEIPYDVVKQNLVKKIDDLRFSANIDEITDVRDESDRNGIRIVIDVKSDADIETILNILYKDTDLQINYYANMVAIKDRRPKLMGVVEIIDSYLEFRREVILKRTHYRYDKLQARLHIIEGLMKAISHLDEVIAIIRASKDRADSKRNLIDRFEFTDEQAESIITLRLYRLSNTDIVELREEFAQALNDLEFLNSILAQPEILHSEMVKEFRAILDEYGEDRKTLLEEEVSELTIDKTALISDEEVFVSVSKEGYVKRSSLRSYQASDQYYSTIKDGDHLIAQGSASTLDHLVFFTKKGQFGLMMVNDLPDHRWKDVGSHLSSIITMDYDDLIVDAILVNQFQTDAQVMLVTKRGKIKKIVVSDLEMSRKTKTFKVINLAKKDELVAAYLFDEGDDVMLVTKLGYAVRYNESQVSSQGLNASGVQSIRLGDGDVVCDSLVLTGHDEILFITKDDLVKRIKSELIEETGRPSRGSLIAKRVKTNPNELKVAYAGDIYDKIPFYTTDDSIMILMKDITLMTKEQTFSKAVFEESHLVDRLDLAKVIQKQEMVESTSPKSTQVSFDLE